LVTLLDDDGVPVDVVSEFLHYLAARGCSPNTLVAYAYDLRHLWTFLAGQELAWDEFRPRHALGTTWSTCARCPAGVRGSGSA
jgi:Phage integrase, N-terminal SAM-like domain